MNVPLYLMMFRLRKNMIYDIKRMLNIQGCFALRLKKKLYDWFISTLGSFRHTTDIDIFAKYYGKFRGIKIKHEYVCWKLLWLIRYCNIMESSLSMLFQIRRKVRHMRNPTIPTFVSSTLKLRVLTLIIFHYCLGISINAKLSMPKDPITNFV